MDKFKFDALFRERMAVYNAKHSKEQLHIVTRPPEPDASWVAQAFVICAYPRVMSETALNNCLGFSSADLQSQYVSLMIDERIKASADAFRKEGEFTRVDAPRAVYGDEPGKWRRLEWPL